MGQVPSLGDRFAESSQGPRVLSPLQASVAERFMLYLSAIRVGPVFARPASDPLFAQLNLSEGNHPEPTLRLNAHRPRAGFMAKRSARVSRRQVSLCAGLG